MSNIKFHYLYRDASNYKKWSDVVFSNGEGLPPDAVTEALRNAFSGGVLFTASQIRVPEVFLFSEYHLTPDDHCFHEFYSVEATSDVANDSHGRSIREFVAEVATEARRGWAAFDPQDLVLSLVSLG
jgi:hypothetical protein